MQTKGENMTNQLETPQGKKASEFDKTPTHQSGVDVTDGQYFVIDGTHLQLRDKHGKFINDIHCEFISGDETTELVASVSIK